MKNFLIGIVALIACIEVGAPPAAEPPTTTLPKVERVAPVRVVPLPAETTTTTSTTTTVVLPLVAPDTPCQEWVPDALDAGWPADREIMERMMSIMHRESRCITDAFKADDPNSGSIGLLQINTFWCEPRWAGDPGWLQLQGVLASCQELYDGPTNLAAGAAIFYYGVDRYGTGWSPWRV